MSSRDSGASRRPLSAGQRRIWFLQTRDPEDTTLNTCAVFRLRGAVDPARLRAAVDAVVARHEILRSTYLSDAEGEPYRVARADVCPAWQELDVSELAGVSRARRLEVLVRRAAGRPFDPTTESPLRCLLIRTATEEFAFALVAHAIGWDDESWPIFCDEVSRNYNGTPIAPNPVEPDPIAALGRSGMIDHGSVVGDGGVIEGGVEYWRHALRPLPQPLELPGRTVPPGSVSPRAARRCRDLSPELVRRAEDFARSQGTTLFAVLLAAYDVLLHRYTAATDFLVSVPVSLRAGDEGIGYFGNSLLLRAAVRPTDTFADLTAAVGDTVAHARTHRGVGIDRVVREVNPERGGGRDGLEQLVRTAFGVRERVARFAFDDFASELLEFGSPSTRIPLSLTVVLAADGARIEAEYQADLLEDRIVEQVLTHYVRLLETAPAQPQRRIGDLDMFGGEDRAGILAQSHGDLVASEPTTLVALFERSVAHAPEATALVSAADGDREYSYDLLDRRANRLAHGLIRRGIGPEDIVGLRLTTSVDFVVAVLAVLKAGAAYLPIDPAYPAERIDRMVADARPGSVLGHEELRAAEDAAVALPDIAPTDADRVRPLRPDNLAYIIYTSGSTGTPKGVPVAHAAIAEHVTGFCAEWGMEARDRLLQSSSVSFDASLLDLFVTLTLGACLVVPKPDAFRDIPYVADLIARCGVTVLHMVPSLLRTFLMLPEVNEWRALRHVPVGGEALHGEVADRFAGVFDAELRNHYGPTEAVVSATHLTVEGPQGTRIVPIGHPNRNVYVYLLDERLQLVPTGVVGEIYLGGTQLARGYLRRTGATAERFVADPFQPGRRLYRTGDLARRTVRGELEFLGRADEQVKVRGYRIELGEVEVTVASHPAVAQCVATAVPDKAIGTVLAAYVVPAGDAVDIDAVRAHAAAVLPEYMVPSAFAVIDDIPLTEHGKLDRRALPRPAPASVELYREPVTATEIRLAELFGQLFGADRVGADDSFFDLGGHSLLAARLLARIRAEFDVEIGVRVLFETPTVGGLAALVEAAAARNTPLEVG